MEELYGHGSDFQSIEIQPSIDFRPMTSDRPDRESHQFKFRKDHEMESRDVFLDEVVIDERLNLRDHLDQEAIERYEEVLKRLPPLTLYNIDDQLTLVDGFHRFTAATNKGLDKLPAEIHQGSYMDALDFAAGANLWHGVPPTRAERRRMVEIKLKMHHEMSDRALSEQLSVSRELIAKVRKILIDAQEIPSATTRMGADGKLYPTGLAKDERNERKPGMNDNAGEDVASIDETGGTKGARKVTPWDDANDPMPTGPPSIGEFATASDAALGASGRAPEFLREMPTGSTAGRNPVEDTLDAITRTMEDLMSWLTADEFADGYKTASRSARDRFQQAVLLLSKTAERLHTRS